MALSSGPNLLAPFYERDRDGHAHTAWYEPARVLTFEARANLSELAWALASYYFHIPFHAAVCFHVIIPHSTARNARIFLHMVYDLCGVPPHWAVGTLA